MDLFNGNRTVKQYFGANNQHCHTPVMYKEKAFYMIKIQKVTDLNASLRQPSYYSEQKQQQQNSLKNKYSKANNNNNNNTTLDDQRRVKPFRFQISFEVGSRSSSQTIQFQINYHGKKNANNNRSIPLNDHRIIQMFKDAQKFTDIHIFPFEKQQVMTIMLKNLNDQEEYGYALMPLVPFLKMPLTKHQVEVELVFQNDKKEIRNEVAAVVQFSLYFLHNFEGHLFIQPVEATLTRNLAQIGQMSPMIRMFLRDKQFSTQKIQQGGINPNWQSSNRFCYFNIPIQSPLDELFIYMFYNREVTMDEMVGWYKVDLQNQGLFKWGESIQSLIKQQAQKRKKQKLDIDWLIKQRQPSKISQLANKQKKGSKLTKQLANVNKTQKLYILSQQKRQQMQQHQLMWISKEVDKVRAQLIDYTMHNITTLTSQEVPQIVLAKMENIYQLYLDREEEIFDQFEKVCQVDVGGFVGEDLEELKRRSVTTLKWEKVREEVKKMLMREVKGLMKFAEEKMQEIKVPIMYNPVNQQGEDCKPVEVGRLTLKYLFLYDFELPLQDEEELLENERNNYYQSSRR